MERPCSARSFSGGSDGANSCAWIACVDNEHVRVCKESRCDRTHCSPDQCERLRNGALSRDHMANMPAVRALVVNACTLAACPFHSLDEQEIPFGGCAKLRYFQNVPDESCACSSLSVGKVYIWGGCPTLSTPRDTVTTATSAWKLRPSAHLTVTPEAPHCILSTTAPYLISAPAAMCSARACAHMVSKARNALCQIFLHVPACPLQNQSQATSDLGCFPCPFGQ